MLPLFPTVDFQYHSKNIKSFSSFIYLTDEIEKRRAEVNEEMAGIVNRFETVAESYPVTADAQDDTMLNDSAVTENLDESRIDETEDDNYYRRDFKSSAAKVNDRSGKRDDNPRDHKDDKHYMKMKHGNYDKTINSCSPYGI